MLSEMVSYKYELVKISKIICLNTEIFKTKLKINWKYHTTSWGTPQYDSGPELENNWLGYARTSILPNYPVDTGF